VKAMGFVDVAEVMVMMMVVRAMTSTLLLLTVS
jgi:hypothetical protein